METLIVWVLFGILNSGNSNYGMYRTAQECVEDRAVAVASGENVMLSECMAVTLKVVTPADKT